MADGQTKVGGTILEVAEPSILVAPEKTAIDRRREQKDKLTGMRDDLFRDSMRVISDSLRFRDVDPTVAGDDESRDMDPAFMRMVEELGLDEATKTYRLARASWATASDAPVGIKVATNIAVGIMKANAAEKGGSHVLNVGRIMIGAEAIPQFEEREVE